MIDGSFDRYGFHLEAKQTIDEIRADAYVFRHEPSGARLLALLADDDNKVFSIAFRTPPASSNGLPHILEHAVLNGSRKYPLKEPFVELAKGSLNTFLNAMTFPDKTVYPVASRNPRDLRNLMDVYLDAVFYPNLKHDPHILAQEGWHYELNQKDDPLVIRGVVYNEMKGAYSTPESVLYQALVAALYPDTPYRFDSGGDPDVIPTLTQAEFVRFHETYYHPSNSYLFLYGDVDLEETLKYLNDAYLAQFERRAVDSALPLTTPFAAPKEVHVPYAVAPDERPEGKDYLSVGFVVHDALDTEQSLAFDILKYILLDSPAAPLKEALLRAGFGQDVFGMYEAELRQPLFAVVAKGANRADLGRFAAAVDSALRRFAAEGLPPKLVEGAIARTEFALREADTRGYPKGLVYNFRALGTWLYDGDPFQGLRWRSALEKIKSEAPNGYFERLIEERLLNNRHRVHLALEAVPGLTEQKESELRQALEAKKKALSEAEIERLIAETKALLDRQKKPDDPETLALLPQLTRDDVPKTAEWVPTETQTVEGTRLFVHPIATNGIGYMSFYFPLGGLAADDLPYAAAIAYVLGKVDTTERGYADVTTAVDRETGGIRFSIETIERYDAPRGAATGEVEGADGEAFTPYLVVRVKALTPKIASALALVGEIMQKSRLDDAKRLRQLFAEQRSRIEMMLYDRGHIVAAERMLALFSPAAKVRDLTGGIEYYRTLKNWLKADASAFEEVLANLRRVYTDVVRRDGLVASLTGEEEELDAFTAAYGPWVRALRAGDRPKAAAWRFDAGVKSEALLAAAKVQYVAKGYNFKALGYDYTGALEVLKTILSYDYLWNRVRVQGGAYGSMVGFERGGNVYFVSYRDPHLEETLAVFDEVPKYIARFSADEREMTKYVLGTISRLDRPLSPSMKGERGDRYALSGLTEAIVNAERAEILGVTPEDIRALAPLVEDVLKHGRIAVLGGSERLRASAGLFQAQTRVTED
ncbi:MAG: insulinase family protein [Hydrogenibacillus sp.]|nr:insulinase family protein [Hydrogenibacillus sp.]